MTSAPVVTAAPAYAERREVFDAGEAGHLVRQGWKLLEHVTVSRWASGYHSESTTYVLGLPRPVLTAARAA